MRQYLTLLSDLLENGEPKRNERTGEQTRFLAGCHLRFDLREGFPAVTTKKLAFKSALGELIAFLRGATSAADFRALGCKVWDQNANENASWLANPFRQGEDHLGDVYGAQWRRWPAFKIIRDPWGDNGPEGDARFRDSCKKVEAEGWKKLSNVSERYDIEDRASPIYYKEIDQLGDCVRKIITDPSDRRILFHGWNPATLDEVALPACHLLYQFLPNPTTKNLSMNLYIRSWDVFLGGPFNIASAALLLSIVARLTGYTATILNVFGGDVHLYESHVEQARLQLTRTPHPLPRLAIDEGVPSFEWLCQHVTVPDDEPWPARAETVHRLVAEEAVKRLAMLDPQDFMLMDYRHHDAIKAPMAV